MVPNFKHLVPQVNIGFMIIRLVPLMTCCAGSIVSGRNLSKAVESNQVEGGLHLDYGFGFRKAGLPFFCPGQALHSVFTPCLFLFFIQI